MVFVYLLSLLGCLIYDCELICLKFLLGSKSSKEVDIFSDKAGFPS